jgi:ATP-binding cassette, subfamily B, bacterial PglK
MDVSSMSSQPSLSQCLKRLWLHLSSRRRWQLGLVLVLMILSSFAEAVNIGAILPFLAAITAPDRVFNLPAAQPVIELFGLKAADQMLMPLSIIFGVATLLAGGIRLSLLWVMTRLSHVIGSDLSVEIYRRTLFQSYAVHIARNSSEIISGILVKTSAIISGGILPVLMLCNMIWMLFTILFVLLAVDPVIAVSAYVGFGGLYCVISYLTKQRLMVNSVRNAKAGSQVVKCLQEGLGGIRDVLVGGLQNVYCDNFRSADVTLRKAESSNNFIGQSPRYVVEALGMVLIAGLAYMLSPQPGGLTNSIPVLGALALGSQRLLPVLQQGYTQWAQMRGSQASLLEALNLLDQPLPSYTNEPDPKPIPFEQSIVIKDLGFRYTANGPWVFHQLNLEILKGERVGFIGTTGVGKSTLLDILMGLLESTKGKLLIDGLPVTRHNHRSWQTHIAHVPQNIYLSDNSIAENIAFGVAPEQIDHERLRKAAQQAQVEDFIEECPDKYDTFIGEQGIRLSGGQRQRIGIARALYQQANVIIFDEATSALDNETERAVMESIEAFDRNLTLLIIAHRLTTLRGCDKIVELSSNGIERTVSYATMIEGVA